jgi:hypothetical protein
MNGRLLLSLVLLPIVSIGQIRLSKRYVDDRINNLTYLNFNVDSTFEYRFTYDLMGDFATGNYKQSKDTIFLFYKKDTVISNIEKQLTSHADQFRTDTLILMGNKLFEVKNKVSTYHFKPIVIDSKTHKGWKPPKSWNYKRKFLFIGPYESTHSGRYYMIEEQYAYWNKIKQLNN